MIGYAAGYGEFHRPGLIVATVLGFIFFWPVGLALLFFSLWRGRMACWHHGDRFNDRWDARSDRWQQRADARAEKWRDRAERASRKAEHWFGGGHGSYRSSGNRAFDEYRTETLRRLEEEQGDFVQFLDRLRMAKDKAEFDEFLAERRRRASEGTEQAPPA